MLRQTIFSVILMLMCAAQLQAATITNSAATWPSAPNAQTLDVISVATATGARNVANNRQLRQTFKNSADFTVEKIYTTMTGMSGENFRIIFYEVADTNAATWTAGNQVGPEITVTGVSTSGASVLEITLDPGEQFVLPQRDSGTEGYALTLQTPDGLTGNAGGWLHTLDAVDYFVDGTYYSESSRFADRDMGIALEGTAGGGSSVVYANPNVMLVVRAADLSNGFDLAIRDRLLTLGYTVEIVEGGAFVQATADSLTTDSYGAVVVSESISSTNVDEIIGTTVPMLHNEPYGWDNIGIAGPASSGGTWFPDSSNILTVIDDTHPVMVEAGVANGNLTVYNQLTNFTRTDRTLYGKELANFGPDATIIATGDSSTTATTFATIFAYEKGGAMFSGTANNRIFGLPLPGDEAGMNIPAADIRDEYWAIFDAAMDWLAPLAPVVGNAKRWTMFE